VGSRKGQLVCQHIEKISRKALENYQVIIKEFVKARHGVYALYTKNGRLRYVGLASDLRNRLKTHLKDRHADTWEKFSVYLTITDAHLLDLESLIIRIASPKENRNQGRFIQSDDLKSLFRKRVRQSQERELDDLVGDRSRRPAIVEMRTIDGKNPILAPYVNKRFEIRYRYKSKIHRATVRKNGEIFYNGKKYRSPSGAGAAVAGRAVDGWYTWKYERAPGDWVRLHELRKH
jgi:hypothetical protein